MNRLLFLAAVFLAARSDWAVSAESPETAFVRPVPKNHADLKTIQKAARQVAEAGTAATVGLVIGPSHGSGVIVTEDGYVLTAAHVVGLPGQDVAVYLPDGRIAQGKTLGMHASIDCGLIKIQDSGPWPFAPLAPRGEGPKVGEWCVALGHPSGFQMERSAPVRVGRLIDVQKDVLRTDCTITGGDSGGPLLDLRGRVIGIHSRISEVLTENLHGPVLACHEGWDSMVAGEIYPPRPASRVLERLDVDRDGHLTRGELKSEMHRRVFDKITSESKLDPTRSLKIDEVIQALGWTARRGFDFGLPYIVEHRSGSQLPAPRYTTGREVRAAFRTAMVPSEPVAVEVRAGGSRLAYGTIVDKDGLVLTKATQLRNLSDVECRLRDGAKLQAKVVAVDGDHDLALLRLEDQTPQAAEWGSSAELVRGDWLVSQGVRGVVKVGVVSVGPRKIVGLRGVLGIEIHEDSRVFGVRPESGAAEAGIRKDDVVHRVVGKRVASLDEIKAVLRDYRAGDVVTVTVVRGEDQLDFQVTLGHESDLFGQPLSNQLTGPLSRRRDSFPTVIQHDSMLEPTECGGPVLNLSGKIVGINVARADRIASYMLPSEKVQELIARLKAKAAAGG